MSTFTNYPVAGDIVCFDSGKQKKFIKYDATYSGIPAGLTAVGVVFHRIGNLVWVVNKVNNVSRKWADVFLWRVYNYTLDGASHNATFTIDGVAASVTYAASTIEGLAEQINAVISTTDFKGQRYTCYVRNGEVVLQHNNYSTYKAVSASGVSVTQYVAPEIVANSGMARWNGGRSGEGSVLNLNRALLYYRSDNSSTTYNPASDVKSLQTTYPICKPGYLGTSQYQSDHCKFLRDYYGEGEEGWLKYMKAQMVMNPSSTGALSVSYRDGKELNSRLRGQTYLAEDGTQKSLYPAFDHVATIGYNGVDGLDVGDWYLPTIEELSNLIAPITYPAIYKDGQQVSVARGEADIVNRALNAIGGTAISNNSSYWSCVRCSAGYSWRFGGLNGFAYVNYFYYGYIAAPISLLNLR